MKQQTTQTTARKRRKTGNGRVATRDLVTIGQRWQGRSRARIKPAAVTIYQVYRHEQYVLVYEGERRVSGVPLERINFGELRTKYRLSKEEPT